MVTTRTGVTKAGYFDTAYITWRHWLINRRNRTPSTQRPLVEEAPREYRHWQACKGQARVGQGQNRRLDLCPDARSNEGNYHLRWQREQRGAGAGVGAVAERQTARVGDRRGRGRRGSGGWSYALYQPGDSGWLPSKYYWASRGI